MTQELRTQQASGLLDMLLRAGDAWRNWRALAVLAATAALFVLVMGAGGAGAASGHGLVMLLALPVGITVLLTGFSAAGVLLMDQALDSAPRSIGAALVDGFFCALRYVVLAIGVLLITALYGLLVAALLFVCKIPGLGPILYAVLFPLLAIISAFFFAAYYLFFLLVGPALWSGASLSEAVARLYAIISQKPAQAIVSALMLSLLVGLVSAILFGAVTGGVFFVGGLSAPILGSAGGLESLFGGGYGYGRNSAQGLMMAGMFGAGLVYALVSAAVFVMMILGSCYVYLHLTGDMDFAAAEKALGDTVRKTREQALKLKEEAERRAREAKEEAQRRTEAMRVAAAERAARKAEEDAAAAVAAAEAQPADSAAEPTAAAPACPACGGTIDADDVFCGNCGHRLVQPA